MIYRWVSNPEVTLIREFVSVNRAIAGMRIG